MLELAESLEGQSRRALREIPRPLERRRPWYCRGGGCEEEAGWVETIDIKPGFPILRKIAERD